MTPRPRRFAASIAACAVLLGSATAARAQPLDTASALDALRDARSACRADDGALWGRSLCGPVALVDGATRLVIANDSVGGRRFLPFGDAYVTTLPASQYVANTSFRWGGREWTMVALPLPRDRWARAALVLHEAFHREQAGLGLRAPDALNNHLDERAGRTWLRLEYRALAQALDALPGDEAAARRHAGAALLFRAHRRALYPGSDSLEAALEMQEGLGEYTGQRLASRLTGDGPARSARHVRDYERTPSFVRAFAYGTGPAVGLLLDRFAGSWRTAVRTRRDPGALLAGALGLQLPDDLAVAARARADAYGWAEVDREEAARDSARAPVVRAYRARLADGPTVTLRQDRDSLSWSFDPTTLVGFDLRTTVYPVGTFSAPWGRLEVERGGVLVHNDFDWLRVGAPATSVPAEARRVAGDGWTLTLAAGWSLRPDPAKRGSWVVTAERPD